MVLDRSGQLILHPSSALWAETESFSCPALWACSLCSSWFLFSAVRSETRHGQLLVKTDPIRGLTRAIWHAFPLSSCKGNLEALLSGCSAPSSPPTPCFCLLSWHSQGLSAFSPLGRTIDCSACGCQERIWTASSFVLHEAQNQQGWLFKHLVWNAEKHWSCFC